MHIPDLLSVESAARIAGIAPDELLHKRFGGKVHPICNVPGTICPRLVAKDRCGYPELMRVPNWLLLTHEHCTELASSGKATVDRSPMGLSYTDWRTLRVLRPRDCGAYDDQPCEWEAWYMESKGRPWTVQLGEVRIFATQLMHCIAARQPFSLVETLRDAANKSKSLDSPMSLVLYVFAEVVASVECWPDGYPKNEDIEKELRVAGLNKTQARRGVKLLRPAGAPIGRRPNDH